MADGKRKTKTKQGASPRKAAAAVEALIEAGLRRQKAAFDEQKLGKRLETMTKKVLQDWDEICEDPEGWASFGVGPLDPSEPPKASLAKLETYFGECIEAALAERIEKGLTEAERVGLYGELKRRLLRHALGVD